jgi:nitrite reductase/ring-hydroxylating ferredoxin subunit
MVSAGGASWRIVELDGKLLAHAAVCPHWLGPLGEAPVVEGQVTCPWHGYRFDVRTGECTHGGKARLAKAPKVECIDGEVWLSPA